MNLPLLLVLGGFIGLDATSAPQLMISRPIVAATLSGLAFGHPAEGMLLGVILEAFSLVILPVGAAKYPESGTAAAAAAAAYASV
ncbi:MAG TPA: PTS sugar transporter subunit IIC, partial [Longimicrobiales bacterium]|nr:PTS sugar transporter subunit IIC [Longimicrobiales bacterium]